MNSWRDNTRPVTHESESVLTGDENVQTHTDRLDYIIPVNSVSNVTSIFSEFLILLFSDLVATH